MANWLAQSYVPDLVSVIVPTYNRAVMTLELLDSLKRQTWPSLEVILIDDGSHDGTADAVRRWVDQSGLENTEESGRGHEGFRVLLLEQENTGPGAARNRGLAAARGEFIYCIDSDDIVFPDALAAMITRMRAARRPYCLASALESDRSGQLLPDDGNGMPRQHDRDPMKSRWMTHGALYHRHAVARAGPYLEELRRCEDVEFHWRMAAINGPGAVLERAIGLRRLHGEGQLSKVRCPRQIAHNRATAAAAFHGWARERGLLSPAIARHTARICFTSGVRLGLVGAVEDKRRACATLDALGRYGSRRAALAARLMRPDARAWFVPLRLALLLAAAGRSAVKAVARPFVNRQQAAGSPRRKVA